jgi:F-type H+-transporting ATPase subunit delta
MKKNSPRQFAIALYRATSGAKKDEIEQIVANFATMLANGRQLKLADKIIDEFVNYAKEKAGFVSIQITSATKLDDKTINLIKNVFGKKVEATENIDESIIGGLVVRTKDIILDASIKTQLMKLKQSLI